MRLRAGASIFQNLEFIFQQKKKGYTPKRATL